MRSSTFMRLSTLNPMTLRLLLQKSLALFAGALLTTAFAPFCFFPCALLSTGLLLALWCRTSAKQAFFLGWLYGVGFFATGVYWVFISIHTYGNANIALSFIITSGFIALLALFPALNGYLLNRFFPTPTAQKIVFAFPFLWVFLEWVRSWLFTGFPWLLLGNSQIHSWLNGYGPLFSVYGMSLAVLFSSGLCVLACLQPKRAGYHLLAFTLIWALGYGLSQIHWTRPSGPPLTTTLVQGNIEQSMKWQPEEVEPTLARYMALTIPHWKSDMIIWPESAIPIPLHVAEDFIKNLSLLAKKHHAALITGIPVKASHEEGYYNAVIALGAGNGIYYKHRLVPLGEYTPFKKSVGKLLTLLEIPMSDFISGPEIPNPIQIKQIKIATFICYEIAYPELVRSRDGQIDIILTVSNDAWFGFSIAQAQHLEIAEMRALEMGRPVLFVGNNGLTAIIDAKGTLQAAIAPFETATLTDTVQPMRGRTPWQRMGMGSLLILFFILLFAFQLRPRWKKTITPKP